MADRFDYTGRLTERLRAEQALARGGGTGKKIVTDDTGTYVEEPGIWDPVTGNRIDPEEEPVAEAKSQRRSVLRRPD
jgi:hypothetical protein